MIPRPAGISPPALAIAALATAVGVWMRVHNALHYPADWGFDARFNWQYIYALTRTWALPDPAAGWSTGDPPLYFYLCALLVRTIHWPFVSVPLLGTLAGLGIVALAVAVVARNDRGNARRALLAGGLLLYLPAHVTMSAMVNEEIVGAFFTSAALFWLAEPGLAAGPPREGLRRAALAGLAGGLALLTKLTGAVTIAAGAAAYALAGARSGAVGPAARRTAALLAAAALSAGWFFARNWISFGYLQPFGLPAHELMFSMPPGERAIADYLRFPLAVFLDPQMLHPDLLHSVWGGTYVTTWFDGHRMLLPANEPGVRRLGTVVLLLALLPTSAFAAGLARGARRAWRTPDGADAPLLLLCALAFAGYAFYTWQNPWFAVVKGTSLLALSIPFAFYASEVLADWTRGRRAVAAVVWAMLAGLAVAVVLSGTFDLLYDKSEIPGLDWRAEAA